MKKLILFIALLACSVSAHAQDNLVKVTGEIINGTVTGKTYTKVYYTDASKNKMTIAFDSIAAYTVNGKTEVINKTNAGVFIPETNTAIASQPYTAATSNNEQFKKACNSFTAGGAFVIAGGIGLIYSTAYGTGSSANLNTYKTITYISEGMLFLGGVFITAGGVQLSKAFNVGGKQVSLVTGYDGVGLAYKF